MGLSHGVCASRLKSSEGIEKCVPTKVLKKFPHHRSASPGELIAEIKALPKKCYMVAEPVNSYWWVDAQFRPGDDSTLFVTSGSFMPRANSSWISTKRIPCGRIIKYELDHETIRGEVFSHSFMSNFPKVHVHPSGEYIGYVGLGNVIVETVLHVPVYNKQKDLRNCNYKYCAFSPDGRHFAILLSVSRRFELQLSRVDQGFTFSDASVDLHNVYKGLKGSNAYNEHLECKWSPDSSNIAVCTSIGFLVVLDKALKSVVNVFEDILPNELFPSCAGAFDYDPRSSHQVLAFGTNDRRVFIINTESRVVLYESEKLGPEPVDSVQYSPNGNLLGLSMRNWYILLLETTSLELFFKINIADSMTVTTNISSSSSPFPSIMRLSFSSTGEQLATSCSDGYVRVWQLPCVKISLKDLCGQAILRYVPMSKIKNLSLLKRILDELSAMPTME